MPPNMCAENARNITHIANNTDSGDVSTNARESFPVYGQALQCSMSRHLNWHRNISDKVNPGKGLI